MEQQQQLQADLSLTNSDTNPVPSSGITCSATETPHVTVVGDNANVNNNYNNDNNQNTVCYVESTNDGCNVGNEHDRSLDMLVTTKSEHWTGEEAEHISASCHSESSSGEDSLSQKVPPLRIKFASGTSGDNESSMVSSSVSVGIPSGYTIHSNNSSNCIINNSKVENNGVDEVEGKEKLEMKPRVSVDSVNRNDGKEVPVTVPAATTDTVSLSTPEKDKAPVTDLLSGFATEDNDDKCSTHHPKIHKSHGHSTATNLNQHRSTTYAGSGNKETAKDTHRHRSGRTLRSHTAAQREKEEKERHTDDNTPIKKRKLRSRSDASSHDSNTNSHSRSGGGGVSGTGNANSSPVTTHSGSTPPSNVLSSTNAVVNMELRELVNNLVKVHPKAPCGYQDYLLVTRNYLLANQPSLATYVKRVPPPNLEPAFVELFNEQEEERYAQALKHQSEREHLQLGAEQAVLRAQTRGALAVANQAKPYSFCSILSYNDLTYIPPVGKVDNREEESIRDRFTPRTFIGWLQDIIDTFQNEKKKQLCRQLHEAESLMMVQKMDWEMKARETLANVDCIGVDIFKDIPASCVPLIPVPNDFPLFAHDPVHRTTSMTVSTTSTGNPTGSTSNNGVDTNTPNTTTPTATTPPNCVTTNTTIRRLNNIDVMIVN
ncbi:unnamed protein product [Heterobilharzia americana]|nr:unnamed protein product [Heterobilharzia americana]